MDLPDASDDEVTRRTAHLILDLISAVDADDPDQELPDGWADLIAADLADLGAIHVAVDDETGQRRLNITPLMTSVTMLLTVLIEETALSRQADRENVIVAVRTTVDGW